MKNQTTADLIKRGRGKALRRARQCADMMTGDTYLILPADWPAKSAEIVQAPQDLRRRRVLAYVDSHVVAEMADAGLLARVTRDSTPDSPSLAELGMDKEKGTVWHRSDPLPETATDELRGRLDPHSTDAREWANSFVVWQQAFPLLPADRPALTTWFAGAIMAGYDHGWRDGAERRRHIRAFHAAGKSIAALLR